MPTALIIGASRGIGLELVRQYRTDGWRVIATVRNSASIAAVASLGAEAHVADVTKTEDCAALGWKLDDERLDVAVLSAGVYGPQTGGLDTPDAADFDTVMHTNVLAAMRLLPIVGPLVSAASGKLAVISSDMASIGQRHSTFAWLYRASKAALNSVLADAAVTFGAQGATCVSLHPGWVRTGMGGPQAPLTPEQSVTGIRRVLAGLTPASNGTFINYDGSAIAW
ncbi:MAG TPA: SDR family oxidoreductase [Burkholderiaceae bacterium]